MSHPSHTPLPRVWLRRFAKLVVLATLTLIFLGGQVKSHEAGLAVPDWPRSYGENMFLFHPSNWVGNIFHEHVHRLVASTVGFLCIVLAVWLWFGEQRRWVRYMGYAALGMVIVQGVLGGITVLFLLPTAVSVSHAVMAQTFFVLVIVIAYSLSKEREQRAGAGDTGGWSGLSVAALYLIGLIYVQLILGAMMRHTDSGLAIPDFPSMGGQYLPWFTPDTVAAINATREGMGFVHGRPLAPVTEGQVWIHFLHRLGAVLVTVGVLVTAAAAWRARAARPDIWRGAMVLLGLTAVQISLGVYTVWSAKTPVITSLHVATGAALLGYAVLTALRAGPLRLREAVPSPGSEHWAGATAREH